MNWNSNLFMTHKITHLLILWDLSAAFDIANHHILLSIFMTKGISVLPFKLVLQGV